MRDSPAAGHRKRHLTADEITELWLERVVSAQCTTGNGALFIPQLREFAEGEHPWFVGAELGMAFQAGPAFVDIQATVADDNRQRRHELKHAENERIKQFIAEAKAKGIRTFVKAVDDPRGCTGCSSCVTDARLRPRRSPLLGRHAAWTPKNPNALGRWAQQGVERQRRLDADKDRRAQVRRLTGGKKDLRRLERKQRAAAAREQMQARRNEQKQMRVAVRRAARVVENA